MEDIKLLDIYGAYAGCNLDVGEVYFSVPEGKKWFFEKYAPIRVGFFKFFMYALQHEELHLILHKLGEDDNRLHTEVCRKAQAIALGHDYPEKECEIKSPSYNKKNLVKIISPSRIKEAEDT